MIAKLKAWVQARVAWVRAFVKHAHDKLTTYVGLAVTGFAALTEKAQSLVDSYPSLSGYLPTGPHLQTALHYVIGALGLLAVYTRIRRLLKDGTP